MCWWWMSLAWWWKQHSFLSHDPWPRINTTFRRPLFVLLSTDTIIVSKRALHFLGGGSKKSEKEVLQKIITRLIDLYFTYYRRYIREYNWTITRHKYQSSTLQPKHQNISIRYVAYVYSVLEWSRKDCLKRSVKTYRENDSMHHSLTHLLTFN